MASFSQFLSLKEKKNENLSLLFPIRSNQNGKIVPEIEQNATENCMKVEILFTIHALEKHFSW